MNPKITEVANHDAARAYLEALKASGKTLSYGVGSFYPEDITVFFYYPSCYELMHRKPQAEREFEWKWEYREIVKWEWDDKF